MCSRARLVTYLPGLHVLVHRVAGARTFSTAGSLGFDEPHGAITTSDMGIPLIFMLLHLFRGPSLRAEGTLMQAYAFPRTSGARNSIVIVKIFIFIFLRLKLVLQAKPCKGGRCNLEGWSRLLRISQTQKNYRSVSRGCFNLGQRVFAYNSHTVCRTFTNLVSPDFLNGAESLCDWPRPLPPRKLFR